MDCGALVQLGRKPCIAQPFIVFAGSMSRIDASVVGFNRLLVGSIPVRQFLPANPRRVGIFIKGNIGAAAAILISAVQNPGGYTSCMMFETSNARFEIWPNGAYAASALYACYEAFADFVTDAALFTGMEFIEA